MTASSPLTVIVLAAGEGTRMKSRSKPKVLHGFAGRSLLGHALAAVAPLQPVTTAVVIGHRRDEVQAHLAEIAPQARPVVQAEQNGTGHAVRIALDELRPTGGTVLVLPGDAPLLDPNTLAALLEQHAATGSAATVLTSIVPDPTGYGRVIRDEDQPERISRIVEHKDASAAERQLAEVSALDGLSGVDDDDVTVIAGWHLVLSGVGAEVSSGVAGVSSGVQDDDVTAIAGWHPGSTRRRGVVVVPSGVVVAGVSCQVRDSGVEGPWCRLVSRGVRPRCRWRVSTCL